MPQPTSVSARERNLELALMFMPVPIGVTNEAGEILLFNEAFTTTFGYTTSEMTQVADWIEQSYPDPTYRAWVVQTWQSDVEEAVKLGRATTRREYRVITRCGDVKRVIITLRPVEDLFITTFEDITQRKQDEEELARYRVHLEQLVSDRTAELARKNEELAGTLVQLQQLQEQLVQESKLSSLGELVAGVAHELNTPIGNARTASTTLVDLGKNFARSLETQGGIRKSQLIEFIGQVSQGAALLERNMLRAAELIQSFKQVAVDRTSSQRRRYNLQTVVDEVLMTLHPNLSKTPCRVRTEIETGITIDGYPGPFGQILVNLIHNALTHGLEGHPQGTICVAAQVVGDKVEVTVSDDGAGIAQENLSRVFDPFFTTRLGQGGSGLGLNIVFNIVTGLLGGTITVDSQQGQGTQFRILMPLVAPTADKGPQSV